MTALGWVLLGAVGGMVVGMALAASIAQRFLLLGREERDRHQVLDPQDVVGRLPSELDEPGRHARREDDHTDVIPVVSGPSWPDDMPDDDREWVIQDSQFDRTADAVSGTEDPR